MLFLINEQVSDRLFQLSQFCKNNPITLDRMCKISSSYSETGYCITHVPTGYEISLQGGNLVALMLEQHPATWWARRAIITMSGELPPSLETLSWIIMRLGFDHTLEECKVFVEPRMGMVSVNILEEVSFMQTGFV